MTERRWLSNEEQEDWPEDAIARSVGHKFDFNMVLPYLGSANAIVLLSYGDRWLRPFRLDQVLVHPLHSVQKRLLLGKFLLLVAEISSDGESMRDSAEQGHLVGHLGLDQQGLGGMSFLDGEYGIRLGGADGKGPLDRPNLLFLHEGRMCHVANIDPFTVCKVTDQILGSLTPPQPPQK
jgi:hypothetical protein